MLDNYFWISTGAVAKENLHSPLSWTLLQLRIFIHLFLLLAAFALLTLGTKAGFLLR